jgi:hypothetical protein
MAQTPDLATNDYKKHEAALNKIIYLASIDPRWFEIIAQHQNTHAPEAIKRFTDGQIAAVEMCCARIKEREK